jgi:hypothetical protein
MLNITNDLNRFDRGNTKKALVTSPILKGNILLIEYPIIRALWVDEKDIRPSGLIPTFHLNDRGRKVKKLTIIAMDSQYPLVLIK